jgi:hypothetical protein
MGVNDDTIGTDGLVLISMTRYEEISLSSCTSNCPCCVFSLRSVTVSTVTKPGILVRLFKFLTVSGGHAQENFKNLISVLLHKV